MAKSNTIQIKLVSSADTGFFYVKNKNPKSKSEKLELKKYDPKVRKHVIFKEQKLSNFFLIFFSFLFLYEVPLKIFWYQNLAISSKDLQLADS